MTGVSPVSGASAAGFGYSAYTKPHAANGAGTGGKQQENRQPLDWHRVLTDLEGEVLLAEETLARGRADEIATWGRRTEEWLPPSNLGPLPLDLRERAARLLQHQLAVAEALVERITQSQRQRDLAARMSHGPLRPVPSYIDRSL
jgi:hypothetical protein